MYVTCDRSKQVALTDIEQSAITLSPLVLTVVNLFAGVPEVCCLFWPLWGWCVCVNTAPVGIGAARPFWGLTPQCERCLCTLVKLGHSQKLQFAGPHCASTHLCLVLPPLHALHTRRSTTSPLWRPSKLTNSTSRPTWAKACTWAHALPTPKAPPIRCWWWATTPQTPQTVTGSSRTRGVPTGETRASSTCHWGTPTTPTHAGYSTSSPTPFLTDVSQTEW